jgi:hypothetical protein
MSLFEILTSLFAIFLSRLDLIGAFVPSLLLYTYYRVKRVRRPWFSTLVIRLAAATFLSLCFVVISQWSYDCPTWLGDCYVVPEGLSLILEIIKFLAFYLDLGYLPFIGAVGLVDLTAIASTSILLILIISGQLRKGEQK